MPHNHNAVCFNIHIILKHMNRIVDLLLNTTNKHNRRTTQYLEFLTGVGSLHKAGVKQNQKSSLLQPKYQLQIQRSHSSTLFEVKNSEDELYSDETDVMQALMRQEDERGERCKPTASQSIKQQMRRFTTSSRNLLNLFNRAAESSNNSVKSLDTQNRSLSSSRFSLHSTDSREAHMTELPRRKSVRKRHQTKPTAYRSPRPLLRRTPAIGALGAKTPHIVRSISDDSAVTSHTDPKCLVAAPTVTDIAEYQENARSTPNISRRRKLEVRCASNSADCSLDGVDITSSNATDAEDAEEEDQEDEYEEDVEFIGGLQEIDEEEHATVMELLKRYSQDNADEYGNADEIAENVENALVEAEQMANDENNWIQPGDCDGGDEGMPQLSPRHTLLQELKSFSYHIQVQLMNSQH